MLTAPPQVPFQWGPRVHWAFPEDFKERARVALLVLNRQPGVTGVRSALASPAAPRQSCCALLLSGLCVFPFFCCFFCCRRAMANLLLR